MDTNHNNDQEAGDSESIFAIQGVSVDIEKLADKEIVVDEDDLDIFNELIREGERFENKRTQQKGIVKWMSVLAGTAPQATSNIYSLTNQVYKVDISHLVKKFKELEALPKDGGFLGTFMDKATGKIAGQAILRPANLARALAGVAAIWQVAAFITAQEHLSQINQRLGRLESAIDAIKKFLEAEQAGKLIANMKYIQEVYSHIVKHELSDAEWEVVAHKLETIWLESRAIAISCQQLMEPMQQSLPNAQLSVWRDLESVTKNIQEQLQTFETYSSASQLAHQICFATTILREPLGMNPEISKKRFDELEASLRAEKAFYQNIGDPLQERIQKEFKGTFMRQSSIDAARQELLDTIQKWSDSGDMSREISIQHIQELQKSLTQPLQLIIQTDHKGRANRIFQAPTA